MKKKLFEKPLVLIIMLFMFLGVLPIAAMAADGADNPTTGLTALSFGGDTTGTPSFTVTPTFSNGTKDYTVTVPDYAESLYCNTTAASSSDKITAFRITSSGATQSVLSSGSWNYLYGLTTGTTNLVYSIHTGALPTYPSTTDTEYNVNIQRSVTLKGLTVNETLSPVFNRDTLSYTASVPQDDTTVSITPTAYASNYTVTVNGALATSGAAATVAVKWDANGKMTVPIVVSCDGAVSTTYTLTLTKEINGDTPVISIQPQGATYLDTATTITALKVRAYANGTLSYQWYSNTTNSTDGGTKIDGATGETYTPVITNVGTTAKVTYYYCVVTNTKGDSSTYTAKSDAATVNVKPDPTPTVTIVTNDGSDIPAAGYSYNVGDTNVVALKVNVTTRADGGTWTYKWKKTKTANAAGTNNQQTYTPPTTADGTMSLTCIVTYTLNGTSYAATSTNTVSVTVVATSAQAPTISTQPVGHDYLIKTSGLASLSVSASKTDSGTLTYQWYNSTDNKTFTAIDGAIKTKYTPKGSDTAGAIYYYCKITNTVNSSNGNTYTTTTKSTTATLNFKTVADAGGTWTGDGTQSSPYLIQNQSDLVLLRNLVNGGFAFENFYFTLTDDITLPDAWVPIGALQTGQIYAGNGIYMLPFSGTLDGDNHTVTVPEGGLPLLGYVRSATVKNLNIYGKKIAGYGLVNNYVVDYGPTGDYSDYTAAGYGLTINIDNVTLKSGSSTQMAGFIGGYASGANSIYISNSTVESGVIIGYDKDQSAIGSFAGGFSGTLENCVSYATVYGINHVGGIVGDKSQSMGYCAVMDSAFHGTVIATGNYVGGIFGSGYGSASAPNTPCVSMQNCYCDGSITGLDYVGGIFGGEPGCKSCWVNGIGYIQNNCFMGTVNATTAGTSNIGGIIGYMNSLNLYNIISNNYYMEGCGATKGIGVIASISRTDDPTGADSDKLSKSVTTSQLKDGTVLALLNSGINSSANWVQGDNDPVFGKKVHLLYITATGYKTVYEGGASIDVSATVITATYSDGTTKSIDPTKVTFVGFNSDTKGTKTIEAIYDNHDCFFEVSISGNADYSSVIAAAKTAISGETYTFDMTAANTSEEVKAAIEKEIANLELNGVTATVAVDSVTVAVAGTADNKSGTDGSFSATVTLTKGTGASALSDTAAITGTITATKYSDQPTEWKNPFGDISSDDWYYSAVKYACGNKLFYGTSDTKFDPNSSMTRAMLVTVLYRLDGKTTVTGKNSFTDVLDGQWYTDAVIWASDNKIVTGYGGGLFGINDSITREQMVVILYNYAKYKGNDITKSADLSAFSDASTLSSWAVTAMKWAVGEKFIAGTTTTTLSPDGNATRAQVAAILMRFTNK